MDIQREIRLRTRDPEASASALKAVGFFEELSNDERHALASAAGSSWVAIDRHSALSSPSDAGKAMYVIVEGIIGVGATSMAGGLFVEVLLRSGDVLSRVGLPERLARITEAQAIGGSALAFRFDHEEYRALERRHPGIRESVHRQTIRCLLEVWETGLDFAHHYSVAERFRRRISRIALEFEDRVLPFTHEEIGWLTSLSRSSVTSLVSEMDREGLAHTVPDGRGHGVHVPDPERILRACMVV